MTTFRASKDPNATLDYTLNWAAWLGDDTISTSSWTVPDGMTNESASSSTTTATVWLSGGTAGTEYQVVNRIVTAGGRTDDRTIEIYVIDK